MLHSPVFQVSPSGLLALRRRGFLLRAFGLAMTIAGLVVLLP